MKKYYFYILASILILSVGGYFYFKIPSKSAVITQIYIQEDTTPSPKSKTRYAIPIDNYQIQQHRVQRNEFLASILQQYKVSRKYIHQLSFISNDIFNARYWKEGSKYEVFLQNDSNHTLDYLIYLENAIDYVVFDFRDSLSVERRKKTVTKEIRSLTGEIQLSLYESIMESTYPNPLLVNEVADILGWEVDFFRLNKGDQFKILFEDLAVDSHSIGLGQVLAVFFNYGGEAKYGIYYRQDSMVDGYYDECGQNLQKSLLKYPIKFSRISSRYNPRRFHPVQKRWKAHLGTDFAAPIGTPIRATGNGTIQAAGYTAANGNYVKIMHNPSITTGYLHMNRIAKGIRRGAKVKKGQVIGYVGKTGLATGPHLCYRFWKNGKQVDALRVKIPSGKPVAENQLELYNSHMLRLVGVLDSL